MEARTSSAAWVTSGSRAGMMWSLIAPRRGVLLRSLALLLVGRAAGLAAPASLRVLIDRVMRRGEMGVLPWLVGGVLIAALLQALTGFYVDRHLERAGQEMMAALQMEVQEHVGRLPLRFFDRASKGALASRIMKEVGGLRQLLGTGTPESVGAVVTAGLVLISLFLLNVRLASVTALFLGFAAALLRLRSRAVQPFFLQASRLQAEVTGRLTESLGGVRVVKAYAAERREADAFAGGVRRLEGMNVEAQRSLARVTLGSRLMVPLTAPLLVYVGSREVAAGRMSTGALVSFVALLGYAVMAASQLGGMPARWAEAFVTVDRTAELLRQETEDAQPRRTRRHVPHAAEVRLRGVDFAYEAGKPVLHGIELEAAAGTVTALVGSSGAGKSTVLALLAGFYTAGAGEVLVDGVDVAEAQPGPYREQLGVVFQETFLFSGSLRENVLLGRPSATDEEVQTVCGMAHVEEFARALPAGYDTAVGERGVRLSGGQQQRVCVARAMLRNPRLLLLDEATSSLDSESEALVQDGLRTLMEGRTTFVIAHRLSTIRHADQIVVLEAGRIVERGNHEQLLQARGRYFELYRVQAGSQAGGWRE